MSKQIDSILIVGGGTAGWITAAILAAKHKAASKQLSATQLRTDAQLQTDTKLRITLIETPDIPIIGVGEGTWPSMRSTLHRVGIKESEFLKECRASFKQGSKFVGWQNGKPGDFYYHPFELPHGFMDGNLAQYWVNHQQDFSFSKLVCSRIYLRTKPFS